MFDKALLQAESMRDQITTLASALIKFPTENPPGTGGGENFNSAPSRCEFNFDRRVNPEEDHDAERRRIFEVIERQRARGIDAMCCIHQDEPAGATPIDAPLVRTLGQIVARCVGDAPVVELCPGLLETRFYSSLGIPALAFGPGDLRAAHGPEEFVEIDRLVQCAAVCAAAAAILLG